MTKARYHKVIEGCSLNPDIDLLASGDKTMIGEKVNCNRPGYSAEKVDVCYRCKT